jgi:hypothetical protein
VSAGTISAGRTRGSMFELIDATKIPSRPVMLVARTQLAAASRSGEKPSTTAPRSFSAAALVARPNRVRWNSSHSATVKAMTSTATNSCSSVIERMPRSTWSLSTNGNGLTALGVIV